MRIGTVRCPQVKASTEGCRLMRMVATQSGNLADSGHVAAIPLQTELEVFIGIKTIGVNSKLWCHISPNPMIDINVIAFRLSDFAEPSKNSACMLVRVLAPKSQDTRKLRVVDSCLYRTLMQRKVQNLRLAG